MNIAARRRCTYATIMFYNMSIGIGYAIIFPTIWNYIHLKFGGSTVMLGVIISSYGISSMIANPVVGWLADRTLNAKLILLLAILAEIGGSFMYFMGIADWFLVCSRLVEGIGGGAGAAIIADITRTTDEEDRTPILSMVIAARQFGLIIGPAFNFFLAHSNSTIGPFVVDKYSSPGLFMTVLWIIVELLAFFLYSNLTSLKDEEDIEKFFHGYGRENSLQQENIPSGIESSIENTLTASYPNYSANMNLTSNARIEHCFSAPDLQAMETRNSPETENVVKNDARSNNIYKYMASDNPKLYQHCHTNDIENSGGSSTTADNMMESAERFMQSASGSFRGPRTERNVPSAECRSTLRHNSEQSNPYIVSDTSATKENSPLLGRKQIGFLRDEIVVLLGLSFISIFTQCALETVLTPLAQDIYYFGEMENSLTYFLCGIEVILVFVAIKYISRKVSDRVLVFIGLISLIFATGFPLTFIPQAQSGSKATLPQFVVTVIFDMLGLAVIVVCSSSLLSKIVSQDSQAFAQGLRRSMFSLGSILGPLWGGCYLQHRYTLFAVPLAVCLLILVLFICSYKKLKV